MATESNNTLSEISSEVKAAVANRLRNPFLSVFTLSWVVWNHRLLFVLFGDMKVVERFAYIDKHMYPTVKAFAWLNIVGPALSTALYILVVPWLAERTLVLNLWYQRRQKAAELRSEALELLTEEQGAELRLRVTQRDKTISEVKSSLTGLERKVARFEVQESISGGGDEKVVRNALLKYIQVELFAEKNHFHGTTNSLVKFDEHAYLHSTKGNLSALGGIEKWALKKNDLVLYSSGQEEIGRLVFDASMRGFFHGYVNGVEVLLIAKD